MLVDYYQRRKTILKKILFSHELFIGTTSMMLDWNYIISKKVKVNSKT